MKTHTIGTPQMASYETLTKWVEENITYPHRIEVHYFNPSTHPPHSVAKPYDYEIIKGGTALYMGRKNKEWKDRLVMDLGNEVSAMCYELPLDQITSITFTEYKKP